MSASPGQPQCSFIFECSEEHSEYITNQLREFNRPRKSPLWMNSPQPGAPLQIYAVDYVIRDENRVFYVGQSYLAFNRVWDHIKNGYKWRSGAGRFILCNGPRSMNYEIELMSSSSQEFDSVDHD